jgi:CBS domain-containing protein
MWFLPDLNSFWDLNGASRRGWDGISTPPPSKGASGLPVVDDSGNLVGIVTEGDFLRRTEIGTKRQRPRC